MTDHATPDRLRHAQWGGKRSIWGAVLGRYKLQWLQQRLRRESGRQ